MAVLLMLIGTSVPVFLLGLRRHRIEVENLASENVRNCYSKYVEGDLMQLASPKGSRWGG